MGDGRPLETTLAAVNVLNEDLAVVAMEHQALQQQAMPSASGTAARAQARMTIDALSDGDVRVTAILRSADFTQADSPNAPSTQLVFHAKPGLQIITVPLPKEILDAAGKDLLLAMRVAPAIPPADGKGDRNVTY